MLNFEYVMLYSMAFNGLLGCVFHYDFVEIFYFAEVIGQLEGGTLSTSK